MLVGLLLAIGEDGTRGAHLLGLHCVFAARSIGEEDLVIGSEAGRVFSPPTLGDLGSDYLADTEVTLARLA